MFENDQVIGRVTVIKGRQNGKYPQGNSLIVRGRHTCALFDPTLVVRERAGELTPVVDLVFLSHVHEDHIAGLSLFPERPVYAHRDDAQGIRSIDGLMEMYGHGDESGIMRKLVEENFFYRARPDVIEFEKGAAFDLGGSSVRVIPTPGHTRGHCCFLIEPEGVLFLADIDLTRFGPYYGDRWSDLEEFERTLELVAELPAKAWVTSHHAGVFNDHGSFLGALDRYRGRIVEREEALLAFLAVAPRTLDEMVAHRFLFPRHVELWYVALAERRTIEQHLERLAGQGRIEEVEPGAFVAHG